MLKTPRIYASYLSVLLYLLVTEPESRQLAGIKWEKLVERSELVFTGSLIKGELSRGELSHNQQTIYLTYKVNDIFKGGNHDTITFISPLEEQINKEIGRTALVFLKKENGVWRLSVDERSSWSHINEMKENFHGFPVYSIRPYLVYDVPEGMGEKMNLKRRPCSEYRDSIVFVYPKSKVDNYLDSIFKIK
jgi:hypothetical protein